jgi:hypothetical protein
VLVFLLACAPEPARCGPGEIVVESKGERVSTLAEAFAAATYDDVICVGEGAFRVTDVPCAPTLVAPVPRALRVEGAGSGRTVIVGDVDGVGAGCRDVSLAFGPDQTSIGIGGVTFEGARLRVDAEEVVLRDVRLRGVTGDGWRAIDLDARRFIVDDVVLSESRLDYAGGFRFDGDGEITDFSVRDVVYEEGYLGELQGEIAWRGGEVAGNRRILDSDGYDLVEAWGAIAIEDVAFLDNRTNGPLLTTYGTLTGLRLVVTGNDATGATVLEADAQVGEGALRLVDSVVSGNVGRTGAIGLAGGTVALDGVDFAGNAPCDVVVDGACAVSELGEDASMSCDAGGCR